MSRRAVTSAVCASGNGAFEAAVRRVATVQQRSFSSTPQRNAQITQFHPSSSEELDSLLSTIRNKLILPSYLPTQQRKRLYKLKYEKQLQSDPTTMELDEEVIKFRYVDQNKEVHNTSQTIVKVVSQFQDPEDYKNLKPLLEGLAHAKRRITSDMQVMILRAVCEKGQVSCILDCARAASRTLFKLDSSEKVNELMLYLQLKAQESEWDEAETKQALRWSEMVVEMLYDKEHQPKRSAETVEGELALTCDPMVLIAPMHLGAILAERFEADAEVVKKVTKLAKRVVAYWPQGKGLEMQPAALYTNKKKLKYLGEANKRLAIATPLLHGLETAAKVVEPALAEELMARHALLKAEIETARQAVTNEEARGVRIYNQFYGA